MNFETIIPVLPSAFVESIKHERRENRKTSRAEDRAHLKEMASKYGGTCRVHGNGEEVRAAWAAYCAAVDRIVGDL